MELIIGLFILFHALVHVFYGLQSIKVIELKPVFTWPDDSWLFKDKMDKKTAGIMIACFCFIAAAGFFFSGIWYLAAKSFLQPVLFIMLVLSSVIYLACWDGRFKKVDTQGFYGILINIALYVGMIYLG